MTLEQEIRQQAEELLEIPVSLGTEVKGQERPYGVVYVISSVPNYTHQGYDGTKKKRFQINVYGDSYPEVKTLATQLYPIDTFTSSQIHQITILNEIDSYDSQEETFGVFIDIEVKQKEGN
jgi:hypothetical protein